MTEPTATTMTDDEFMAHWNEYHVAASTDDKADGVNEVDFFRMVHEQDHDYGEGFTVPHDHEQEQ